MFAQVEEALAARIKTLIKEVGDRTPSLADLLEGEKLPTLPAIAIAFDSYKPVAAAGADNKIASTWLLGVAVSTARQRDSALEVRTKALDIAGRLLEGLIGWRPCKGYTPFVAAAPGGPIWIKARSLYVLPVAVTTTHVIRGVEGEY